MSSNVLPAGSNWLTPSLTVVDAAASLDFYEKAFGFERGMEMPGPDGKPVFADMKYQGNSVVMIAPEGAWGGTSKAPVNADGEPGFSMYIYHADVNALTERARKAGCTVTSEPEDMFWGDRCVHLKCINGHNWAFATKVGEFDPSKMPQF